MFSPRSWLGSFGYGGGPFPGLVWLLRSGAIGAERISFYGNLFLAVRKLVYVGISFVMFWCICIGYPGRPGGEVLSGWLRRLFGGVGG